MAAPQATTKRPRKGRGGRPKKADGETRHVVPTRMTIAEHNHARDMARQAGLSLSEYLRRRALGEPITVRQGKTDARLIHELNAIGVNLNQIARNVNSDRLGAPGSRLSDLDALQRQLRGVLDRALEGFDDD
ncbi:MAG: plasmid mobilization relaxosome protein MobC [Planctomycetota bacterium]